MRPNGGFLSEMGLFFVQSLGKLIVGAEIGGTGQKRKDYSRKVSRAERRGAGGDAQEQQKKEMFAGVCDLAPLRGRAVHRTHTHTARTWRGHNSALNPPWHAALIMPSSLARGRGRRLGLADRSPCARRVRPLQDGHGAIQGPRHVALKSGWSSRVQWRLM